MLHIGLLRICYIDMKKVLILIGYMKGYHLEPNVFVCCVSGDEKLLLWKKWFDMTYEKMVITKGVTELAYQ